MMGPVFVKEAKRLILGARSAAVRLGAAETGSEHLLLAVAESPTVAGAFLRDKGITPDRVEHLADPLVVDSPLLESLGIDVSMVQGHLDASFGRETWRRAFGPRPKKFSAEATRALKSTVTQAQSVRSKRIDAAVVLLALLHDGRQAGMIVRRLGVEPVTLASQLRAAR